MDQRIFDLLNQQLIGAIALGFAAIALFFFRFWRESHDRLFAFFGVSCVVLAINRVALGLMVDSDARNYLYWVRFLAYGIILWAILDKNRTRAQKNA